MIHNASCKPKPIEPEEKHDLDWAKICDQYDRRINFGRAKQLLYYTIGTLTFLYLAYVVAEMITR